MKPGAAVSRDKTVGEHLCRLYLFEKYDLQHTCYGESGNHTGECYQSLIGRYVGYLTEITGGPVIAYSFNAALKE